MKRKLLRFYHLLKNSTVKYKQDDPVRLAGTAGSLVVILLWIFSAIIFFYGAEITQQYAHMYPEDIVPKKHAVRIQVNEVT